MNNHKTPFQIDRRLQQDCFEIGSVDNIHILVQNNSFYQWIVLVPQTDILDFHLLPEVLKSKIFQLSDQISQALVSHFGCNKINTASIGNIVNQVHFHIIGRNINDPAWPGVVWGHSQKKEYSKDQKQKLIDIFCDTKIIHKHTSDFENNHMRIPL